MTVTTAKWTIDEYHHMIAAGILDNRRIELLKGEIVEMPSEGEPHAYLSSETGEYLIQLLGNRATVRPSKPINQLTLKSGVASFRHWFLDNLTININTCRLCFW
jgi:Uma2 family endonuclease